MVIQTGVGTDIAYKLEGAFGTLPAAAGADYIRRVASSVALTKQAFESNEVRPDQQVATYRHGMREVGGDIEGELSPLSYAAWMEAVLRGTWEVGASASEVELTNVVSSTSTFTFGGGSLLTEGFRVGNIVRFTGLPDAANNNKNLRITALTATTMTVAETLVANAAPDTSFTVAVQGSKVYAPTARANIIKRSFSIEQYYSDLDASEVFTGCRIGRMALALPPTGIATATWGVTGQDSQYFEAGVSPYFTTPTDAPTTEVVTSVNGVLRFAGVDIVTVTDLTIDVNLGLSTQAVVGSNVTPDVFYGRTRVSGTLTALLSSLDLLQDFKDETEIELQAQFDAPGVEPRQFISFFMPRIKLGGGRVQNRGEQGTPVEFDYMALLKGVATGYDNSTMVIQDSQKT